jgi:hypothetical protein
LPQSVNDFNFINQCIFKQGHLDVELNEAGRQQAAAVSYDLYITCFTFAVGTQMKGYEPEGKLSFALAFLLILLFLQGG